MKSLLLLFIFLAAAVAQAQVERAPVNHLYVPSGFDANDAIEVVVTGEFPTPCYGRHNTTVKVNRNWILIEVLAIHRDQPKPCPDMTVPFQEVISVGQLPAGSYRVLVNGVIFEQLDVNFVTSSGTDDYLYAAIDQIERISATDYILHGWRYSSCVEAHKVKIISNGRDTLSLLPIMKQVSDFCPHKMTPVSFPVRLELTGLETKFPLLHVRTMDGKSFNTVLSLERR